MRKILLATVAILIVVVAAVIPALALAQASPAPPARVVLQVDAPGMTIVAYCEHLTAGRVYGLTHDVAAVASGCSAQPGVAAKPPPRALRAPARLVLVLPGFQVLLRCTQVVKFGDEALFTDCAAL